MGASGAFDLHAAAKFAAQRSYTVHASSSLLTVLVLLVLLASPYSLSLRQPDQPPHTHGTFTTVLLRLLPQDGPANTLSHALGLCFCLLCNKEICCEGRCWIDAFVGRLLGGQTGRLLRWTASYLSVR